MRFLDRDHDPRTSSGPRSVQTAKSRPDTCEHSTGVHSCRNQALTEGVSTHASRGMRAPRAGEESRRPAIAGSRPATRSESRGSASRRLTRQQQAAKERWSLSRQGEAWFRRLRLRDDRLRHPPARSQRRKACSARVIEREDRTRGSAGHSGMPRRRGPEEHPLLVRPGGDTPVYPPASGAAGSRDRPGPSALCTGNARTPGGVEETPLRG